MKPAANHGVKRIIRATGFSIQGLIAGWKHEAAFREESIIALVLLPVAILLPVTSTERILLILTLFIVLIVELVNSAIEAAVDRISDEIHPLSGRAKDIASAAVFLSLIFAITTWGQILFPLLSGFFSH